MASAFDIAPGELLAVDVPAGPAWVPLLHRLWSDHVTFLPLDERLTPSERTRLLDLARPAAVLGIGGALTVYAGAAKVDEDLALVMATSGTGGSARLVELARDSVEAAVAGSFSASADSSCGIVERSASASAVAPAANSPAPTRTPCSRISATCEPGGRCFVSSSS